MSAITSYLYPTTVEKVLGRHPVLHEGYRLVCRRETGRDVSPSAWDRIASHPIEGSHASDICLLPGDPDAKGKPVGEWSTYVFLTPLFLGRYALGFVPLGADGFYKEGKLCAAVLEGGPVAMRIGSGALRVWGRVVADLLGAPTLGRYLRADEFRHEVRKHPKSAGLLGPGVVVL
jgi:hypothetical protein